MMLLSQMSYALHGYSLFFFILGALFGSFYNVLIFRIPEKTLFQKRRSHCRHCGALIPFWLNIPLLSWFFLRGKTACCNKPLSWQYPVVEWVTAIGFVVTYWHMPFLNEDAGTLSIHLPDFIRFLHLLLFLSVLWIGSVIDIRLKIIPNELTFGMILLAPLWMLLHPELSWQDSLIGIVVGGLIPYLIAWIYYLIRKEEGLGMGDVKLLAGIGGWAGYNAIIPSLVTGSIIGSIVGLTMIALSKNVSMKYQLPYGPFLSFGAATYMFTGKNILDFIF